MTEAPSPFLENSNMQWAFDSTSLGWLKTCPRLYYYSMIEGWRSRHDSVHLLFGGWYASALEYYHKLRAAGDSHDICLRATCRSVLENTFGPQFDQSGGVQRCVWNSDHPAKNRATLIRSVIWYLDHWEHDNAKVLILGNGKPAVELSFRLELDGTNILCGHLDRVVGFNGDNYVMDQKTSGSTLSSYYFNQFEPHNQMSLYSIAAKVVFNTPVKGVIIDAAQIAVGFTEFGRGMTYRTDEQSEEWLRDVKVWIELAKKYADENYWPQNDTACDKYGGCTFRKVCSKSPQVRDIFLNSDFVKRPWNPLSVR